MKKISTGQDSSLKTYREIAFILGGFKDNKATEFIDKKILESKNGENEEVLADERQVIQLLYALTKNEEDTNNESRK